MRSRPEHSPGEPLSDHESDRQTWLPTNFDARSVSIKEDPRRPDVLIRESLIEPNEDPRAVLASFQEAKALFKQMQEQYGVRFVAMDPTLVEVAGRPAVQTVVERIDGENVFDAKSLPPEMQPELEEVYISLAHYYETALRSGGTFWGDCKSSQFVYGNKVGEQEKHLYIVDVDPSFFRPGEDRFYTPEWCLNSIANDLVENEQKFHPRVRLQNARSVLQRIIETLLKREPDSQPLLQAKQALGSASHK